MSIFTPFREGSWWLSSKKDPRWNCSGEGIVGGFCQPKELVDELEKLKKIRRTARRS